MQDTFDVTITIKFYPTKLGSCRNTLIKLYIYHFCFINQNELHRIGPLLFKKMKSPYSVIIMAGKCQTQKNIKQKYGPNIQKRSTILSAQTECILKYVSSSTRGTISDIHHPDPTNKFILINFFKHEGLLVKSLRYLNLIKFSMTTLILNFLSHIYQSFTHLSLFSIKVK